MNSLTQAPDFESLIHQLIVMATTTVDVFGNTVTIEAVNSGDNLQMYSGYYNYAALMFVAIGAAVAIPGILLALPFLALNFAVNEAGGYVNTYVGSYAKKYAMFAVMYVGAFLRNLVA